MSDLCPVCLGPTSIGVTPASQPMCNTNDCDMFNQEDIDALMQLTITERLKSIDVMKGRITASPAPEEDFGDIWDEPTIPYWQSSKQTIPPCNHVGTKRSVFNGYTFCDHCGRRLTP